MENFASGKRVTIFTIDRADGFRFVWHGGEYVDVSHRDFPALGVFDVLNWWDHAGGRLAVVTIDDVRAAVAAYECAGSGELVECETCGEEVELLSSVTQGGEGFHWCSDSCADEYTGCANCGAVVHSDWVTHVGEYSYECADCAPGSISEAVGEVVDFYGRHGGWTFTVEGFGRGHLVVGGLPSIECVREFIAAG